MDTPITPPANDGRISMKEAGILMHEMGVVWSGGKEKPNIERGETNWYVCQKCGNACNPMTPSMDNPSPDHGKAALATPEEIKANRRRCWCPDCPHKAFLRDWTGWKWCFAHWYRNLRWDNETPHEKWFYIRTTRFF